MEEAVDLSYDRLLMMMTGCGPVVWQITDDDPLCTAALEALRTFFCSSCVYIYIYIYTLHIRIRNRNDDILISFFLSFFLSQSSLFLPNQVRCRGLFFHVITHSHTTTVGKTPLDEGSARPLPDNTQHSQQTSVPPAGFQPAIPAGDWLQTHALDRSATGQRRYSE